MFLLTTVDLLVRKSKEVEAWISSTWGFTSDAEIVFWCIFRFFHLLHLQYFHFVICHSILQPLFPIR